MVENLTNLKLFWTITVTEPRVFEDLFINNLKGEKKQLNLILHYFQKRKICITLFRNEVSTKMLAGRNMWRQTYYSGSLVIDKMTGQFSHEKSCQSSMLFYNGCFASREVKVLTDSSRFPPAHFNTVHSLFIAN